MSTQRLVSPVFALLLSMGCAASEGPIAEGSSASRSALRVAEPIAADAADRDCRVVLRSAGRAARVDGLPKTRCSEDGRCWWVFEAVAEAAVGADIGLFFRGPDGAWREASPSEREGGVATFRLEEDTIPAGLSATALSRSSLAMIPFVRTSLGGRLFDHNRVPGDDDSYILSQDGGWSVPIDDATCPAGDGPEGATLVFDADYGLQVDGSLLAGGAAVVRYAPTRLPQCFGDVFMAQATWTTLAFARFDGGPIQSAPAVQCDDARCSAPRAAPLRLDIPAGARELELWFQTSGRACGVHWDSNFGANYRFPVRGAVDWVGNFSVKTSRAFGEPCEGATPLSSGSFYGTWARQRATTSHLCFQVWEPGTTDAGAGPEALEVSVRCDWGDGVLRGVGASFDGVVGNDHRYRINLAGVDPFQPYTCPAVPTFREAGYETARAQCQVFANGAPWGIEGQDRAFSMTFADYPLERYEICREE